MLVVRNKKSPQSMFNGMWNHPFSMRPFFANDVQQYCGVDQQSEIPKVNISEDETGYTIELAAPGLAKEDLKVDMNDGLLTITSEKKKETEEKTTNYLRKEFAFHGFKRSFKLPENADLNSIRATYNNGVLNVVISKKSKEVENSSKTITIS